MLFLFLSREWGSNPRPTVYDTAALPAELSRHETPLILSRNEAGCQWRVLHTDARAVSL